MNVGMDELDRLLKRYVSTGAAVVVVILGPGQTAVPDTGQSPTSGAAATVTVAPRTGPGVVPTTAGGPATSTVPTLTAAPTTTPPPTAAQQNSTSDRTTDRTTDRTRTRRTASPGTDRTRATSSRTRTPSTSPTADDDDTSRSAAPGARSTGTASTDDTDTTGAGGTGTATGATTAAAAHGWGRPTRTEEFDAGTDQWRLYDGPGHDGKGRHAPSAVVVRDGLLTITGDPSGTTGGVSWGRGHRYGRWEGRVRAPAADPSYDAVMLLWPDAENWPAGGEVDFMELSDPQRRTAGGFVHHGADNQQVHGTVGTDATRWHNWAVEWTPSAITMYLDGREWYRTTDRAAQPPGPMHLCIQLDWFPKGGAVRQSTMQVDWVREYALDATGSAPATPATGG